MVITEKEKQERKLAKIREKKLESILAAITNSYWRTEEEDGRWGQQITEISPTKLANFLLENLPQITH